MGRPSFVAAVATLAAFGAGCGGSPAPATGTGDEGPTVGDAAVCEAIEELPLDPGSARHVLPGGPEPNYRDEPPSSGAHVAMAPRSGVEGEPLPRPEQVGLLEQGVVLVQYSPEVDPAPGDLEQVAAVAPEQVLVVPNPDLDDPVVVTAWRLRRRCHDLDPAAVADAVAEVVARAEGAHGHAA